MQHLGRFIKSNSHKTMLYIVFWSNQHNISTATFWVKYQLDI